MKLPRKVNHFGIAWTRVLAIVFTGLAVMGGLAVPGLAFQTNQAEQQNASVEQFAGTWEGKFNGQTFVTIKLTAKDGKLTGTISRFGIQMDQSGNLSNAEPREGEDPVADAKLDGKSLRFPAPTKGKVSTNEGDQPTPSVSYQIKLKGSDRAELSIVGGPSDMPTLAPWKLERIHANR